MLVIASGDKLGAEGLSGFRAFIYAGADLLVSHWSVESTLQNLQRCSDAISSDAGRSQALQSSMVNLMSDPDRPYYSHPASGHL